MSDVSRSNAIFLYGYQGCGNLGDELMALLVIRAIAEKRQGACFRLRSWEEGFPSDGVTYTGIDKALTSSRPKFLRAFSYIRLMRREVNFCTEVVFPGGTVFHGDSRSKWSLSFAFILALLCRISRRPLAAAGVGVSEISGWKSRFMMRFILQTCWLFAVRDRKSLDRCLDLAPDAPIVAASDIVFAVPQQLDNAAPMKAPTRVTIGVALSGAHHEAIIPISTRLADALNSLASSWDSGNLEHWLLSSPPGSACGMSDLFVHQSVFGLVPARTLTTESAFDASRRPVLVVGSRYHALVLAASAEIPFVGIGDDDKLMEICRQFGMPHLKYSDVTGASLSEAADQAITSGVCSEDISIARHSAQEMLAKLAEGPP